MPVVTRLFLKEEAMFQDQQKTLTRWRYSADPRPHDEACSPRASAAQPNLRHHSMVRRRSEQEKCSHVQREAAGPAIPAIPWRREKADSGPLGDPASSPAPVQNAVSAIAADRPAETLTRIDLSRCHAGPGRAAAPLATSVIASDR